MLFFASHVILFFAVLPTWHRWKQPLCHASYGEAESAEREEKAEGEENGKDILACDDIHLVFEVENDIYALTDEVIQRQKPTHKQKHPCVTTL